MKRFVPTTFSDIFKGIFIVLILMQIVPPIMRFIVGKYQDTVEHRIAVAVVPVHGLIYDSSSLCKTFRKHFEDNSIRAILIKMECPGSAAGTGQSIFRELKYLKQEYPKPVVVLVENICASGGYNIACAADAIIAPGSSMIGSIGTTLPYIFNVKDLLEQYKIKYTPIAAGAYKNTANPFAEMTDEQKKLLQSLADDSYEQFIEEVSKSRSLQLSDAKIWADGKVFTGRQALKLGLIDALGSISDAIRVIQEKTGSKGKINWVHTPQKTTLLRMFFGGGDDQADDTLYAFLGRMITQATRQHTTIE